jgi:hypothetical protein
VCFHGLKAPMYLKKECLVVLIIRFACHKAKDGADELVHSSVDSSPRSCFSIIAS